MEIIVILAKMLVIVFVLAIMFSILILLAELNPIRFWEMVYHRFIIRKKEMKKRFPDLIQWQKNDTIELSTFSNIIHHSPKIRQFDKYGVWIAEGYMGVFKNEREDYWKFVPSYEIVKNKSLEERKKKQKTRTLIEQGKTFDEQLMIAQEIYQNISNHNKTQ